MSDDPVETHVVLAGPGQDRVVHFQEWWVRMHAATPAAQIVASGAEQARPAPGVLDAIEAADVVLFPPSNPVVSIGTILAVPGIRAAVAAKTVVGVSPSSAARRCAGWPTPAWPRSGWTPRPRRSPRTTGRS
jgi:Uncharacterized conserved protein